MTPLNLNEKGQEFIGFRLMIGVIIAFFILVIIMSALSYFEGLKTQIVQDVMHSGINSAKSSPNGMVVKKPNVAFKPAVFTQRYFSVISGLPQECIELQGRDDGIVYVQNNGRELVIEKDLSDNLYFRCVTCTHEDAFNSDCEECEINCFVSIGVDPLFE
jgi:hypothetical protein